MAHFGKKLFLFLGIVLLVGSYPAMKVSVFLAVVMRWMGFLALLLMLIFRD
jgi:hypothetical protein